MTDAYAEAGLLDAAALRFGPPEPGRDDFDTEDDYENWLADEAENVEVDMDLVRQIHAERALRNANQPRQPRDCYVIAGLVMERVRDVRPWHA